MFLKTNQVAAENFDTYAIQLNNNQVMNPCDKWSFSTGIFDKTIKTEQQVTTNLLEDTTNELVEEDLNSSNFPELALRKEVVK